MRPYLVFLAFADVGNFFQEIGSFLVSMGHFIIVLGHFSKNIIFPLDELPLHMLFILMMFLCNLATHAAFSAFPTYGMFVFLI